MSKYLLKLILFTLVLGMIPSILIGFASYSIASRDLEKKVKDMNMQWLAETQMRVEQLLKSIEKSATQFANSALVMESMNNSFTSSDFKSIQELTKELNNLQSSDATITQAYLINFKNNWGLNLNVLKPLDQFGNRNEFFDNAKQTKSIFWYTGLSGSDIFSETLETVTLVHKIPLFPQSDKPQGLLVVHITASEIDESLNSSSAVSVRNYIMDQSGADFLGADQVNDMYKEINLAVAKKLETDPEQKSEIFNTSLQGKKVAVLYRYSNYNSWTYISVVAIGELNKETRKIAGLTLLVCIIIIIIVIGIAMYGSKRIYRPIGILFGVASELDSSSDGQLVSTKKNDLEFIGHSMLSLAVTKERIEKQMADQASQLKEFFVLKLITGQISENDYLFRSAMSHFPTGWRKLGVLALQIDNLQETRYREEDRELLLYAVSNIAQEVLPATLRFPPITLSQTQVTLIAMENEDMEVARNILYESAECIKTHAEKVIQIKVSIGISNPYAHLTDTFKAYGESLKALKTRISLGPEIIVHYGDTENQSGMEYYDYTKLKMLEESVVYAVRDMKLNNAVEMLEQYLDSLLRKDCGVYEHQTMLMQLAFKLLQIIQEQGFSLKHILEDEKILERIFHLQTREEIIYWFESNFFIPMIKLIAKKEDIQYGNIADRLIIIIQKQYDQDITLELCSKMLNYHPFYLSRVFKRETGTTFSEYLTEYRMKMAKIMLETTDMKIAEISEKLRYKNISSFIRSYKKMYDITPGQYRDSVIKGEH